MLGAITNTDALKRWFYDNQRPYFTLRYENGGNSDRVIVKNDSVTDMDKAWEKLQSHVIDQSEAGRSRLALIVYELGKHNNPTGFTMIDMRPGGYGNAAGAGAAQISGLPAGVGSITEYVDMKLEMERQKWKIEQLEDQLAAPADTAQRWMETIGAIPGAMDVFKIIAAGIVTKIAPDATPTIQGILNGTPDTIAAGSDHDDNDVHDGNPQERFSNNINETAHTLNIDPLTLSEKLRSLVKTHPDIARQLLQQ